MQKNVFMNMQIRSYFNKNCWHQASGPVEQIPVVHQDQLMHITEGTNNLDDNRLFTKLTHGMILLCTHHIILLTVKYTTDS